MNEFVRANSCSGSILNLNPKLAECTFSSTHRQQVILINPIVNRQAQKGQHRTYGYKCHVQKCEPHGFKYFRISFAHVILEVFHQFVGLSLGDVFTAVVVFSLG